MDKFLVFAVLVMAIGLLFSCTSDLESAEDILGNGDSSSSGTPAVPSSSSIGGGSSSSGAPLSGTTFVDTRDGKTYKWVKIGTQTWMAENLNYAPSSGTFISCDTYKCATYGRLYDWSTAMKVCPFGWHLPSNAEWEVLGDDARKLRATSGWELDGSRGGTDDYGFSALPGGYGESDGSFDDIGYGGVWWSASEYDSYDAYALSMHYSYGYADLEYGDKTYLFSVRCLQDPSSSSPGGGSSSSLFNSSSSSLASSSSAMPAIQSSSSVVMSSSSSLPSGTVFCMLSSGVCSPMALIACDGLSGTSVQSCPVSSSSSAIPSSSSVAPSSSSVVPSSSSSLPSGAVWCKLPSGTCVAISQDACDSAKGTSCDESSSFNNPEEYL